MNLESKQFIDILRGRYENLPAERSNTVRIFLSSTFSDTHEERDYLIEHVYPKLKIYCKTNYGLDFQVLDMRWGINDESNINNMNSSIHVKEVINCQKYSIGPNFVTILSHKYGKRNIPNSILVEDYEKLKNEIDLIQHDELLSFKYAKNEVYIKINDIIQYSYVLDENEVPPKYKFVGLRELIPDYDRSNPEHGVAWSLLETKLSALFRFSAQLCFQKDIFTEDQYNKYNESITEQEIFQGIISSKDAKNNCLAFIREIEDIDSYVKDDLELARKFIDLNAMENIEENANEMLNDLKYVKLKKHLPESNIHTFKVEWDKDGGITRKTHWKYLVNFGDKFYESVKKLIDRNASKPFFLNTISKEDTELFHEVLTHARLCNEYVEKFHGRVDLIDQVKDYVLSSTVRHPFIIHGESGCGKTSLIAKVVHKILNFVPIPANYTIILRFLGTTPSTSNITRTYKSIIYQLSKVFSTSLPNKLPFTKRDLRDLLLEQLLTITRKHPNETILIFLDSIDQLSNDDYNIDWMLIDLPKNVKMIYSTLPNYGDILTTIREVSSMTDSYFMTLGCLDKTIVKTILEDWLNNSKRCLSEEQWICLETLFEQAELLPLYVKLMFDIVVKWPSFFKLNNEIYKLTSIDPCIEYMFKLLEQEHGKILFSKSIFYMTSFKNGISESELEEILSLDDDILCELYEQNNYVIRKFPSALWLRMKNDISEYIVEKEVHDTRVIAWYHRKFIEIANDVYCVRSLKADERDQLVGNVIDYFNETWKDKPKPFKSGINVKSHDLTAVRTTSMQPIMFASNGDALRYNKRKLIELPHFIAKLTPKLAVPMLCERVYFNYEFLHGLLVVCNYTQIFKDLHELIVKYAFSQDAFLYDGTTDARYMSLLALQSFILADYPDLLAIHILSRTLYLYGTLPYFTKFIEQSDSLAPTHCALTAPYQLLQPPGVGPLFVLEKHLKPISSIVIAGDSQAFAFSLSDKICVFNLCNLECLGDIELPKLENDDYQILRIYTPNSLSSNMIALRILEGMAIVVSKHTCTSINFDSTINFTIKFQNVIKNVYQITSKCILLFYENFEFFEVYNIHNGKLVHKETFTDYIKFLCCNSNDILSNESNSFSNIYLTIILENSKIFIYAVSDELKSTINDDDSVKISLFKTIQSPGVEIVDCKTYKQVSNNEVPPKFVVSYKDGSINLIKLDKLIQVQLIKKKFETENTKNELVAYKFLDLYNEKSELYLGSNGNLCLVILESDCRKCITIEGKYTDGCLGCLNHVCAVNKGFIDVFVYSECKPSTYTVKKIGKIDAHFGDINQLFPKDTLLLTISKDTTLKVFNLNFPKRLKKFTLDFDRVDYEISHVTKINKSIFMSNSNRNSVLHLWNASKGTIIESVLTQMETIHQIVFRNNMMCVVGLKDVSGGKVVCARGYLLETKDNNYKFKQINEISLRDSLSTKIYTCDDDSKFILLSKTIDEINSLQVNILLFNAKLSTWSNTLISDLWSQLSFNFNLESTLDSVALTALNAILCLYNNKELFYVSIPKRSTIATLYLRNKLPKSNYFLNGTSKSERILPISKTDDFVGLNNLNQLVYIEYNNLISKIKLYTSEGLTAKFTIIEANGEIICAYDEKSENLFVYEREKCKKDQFKKPLFKAEFKNNSLSKLCISDNNEYILTVELPKIVSLYRIKDGKRIAHVPMYSEISSIAISDNYVAMAMQDRRIVSLLITDPLKPDNDKLIKELPSRNPGLEPTKITKDSIDELMNIVRDVFSEEEDEDTNVEDNVLVESNQISINNVNKVKDEKSKNKKTKKKPKSKTLFELELNVEQIETELDWMLELNKAHSFISQCQLDKLKESSSNVKNQLIAQKTIEMGFGPEKPCKLELEEKKMLLESLTNRSENIIGLANTSRSVKVANSSKSCTIS